MENMRITKNSKGGDLKVLIEEESSTNQREGSVNLKFEICQQRLQKVILVLGIFVMETSQMNCLHKLPNTQVAHGMILTSVIDTTRERVI